MMMIFNQSWMTVYLLRSHSEFMGLIAMTLIPAMLTLCMIIIFMCQVHLSGTALWLIQVPPKSVINKHFDVGELEMLLEAYFIQIDGTLNKLSTFRHECPYLSCSMKEGRRWGCTSGYGLHLEALMHVYLPMSRPWLGASTS